MADDSFADFEVGPFTHDGTTHAVLHSGYGPAVIVMAEIPGITPNVLRFARRVRDAGFTAVLPDLFGTAGRDPNPGAHNPLSTAAYAVGTVVRLCVSREFTMLATGRSSPVVTWLRALARHEHERCGGPGVGTVGMCFTGGFALAMATEPSVTAPVMSQPALPIAVGGRRRATTDMSPEELATVKGRCAAGMEVLGLRFRSDRLVPDERFAFLREHLGEAFVAVELDDDAANPDGLLPPHSVLTEHLIDEVGQPTRQALEQVIDLFRRRLLLSAEPLS